MTLSRTDTRASIATSVSETAVTTSTMFALPAAMACACASDLRPVSTTAPTAGGDPYRRKVPTFASALDRTLDAQVVSLGKIRPDSTAFRVKHEPGNPAADVSGNVKYPNVNPLIEMTDMRDAQRSYEANLNVIGATRRMIQRTIDILKA